MNLQDAGDKVLAESRTFQNQVYFTTYSPQQREYNPEFCVATVGLNRLYIVDAATGKPVVNFASDFTAGRHHRPVQGAGPGRHRAGSDLRLPDPR